MMSGSCVWSAKKKATKFWFSRSNPRWYSLQRASERSWKGDHLNFTVGSLSVWPEKSLPSIESDSCCHVPLHLIARVVGNLNLRFALRKKEKYLNVNPDIFVFEGFEKKLPRIAPLVDARGKMHGIGLKWLYAISEVFQWQMNIQVAAHTTRTQCISHREHIL